MRKSFTNAKPFSCIAPYYPPPEFEKLFTIEDLPNCYGIRTTQEFTSKISEKDALESRLGLSVIDSPFTLEAIGGATLLKQWTKNLLKAEENGYRAKGVFLVGIPGTGKTFFPKCFAGETKRLLIQLNLTLIMESEQPIRKLNQIFEYLSNRCREFPNEKYVLLIDEIEKMIGNAEPIEKRMLGRLLTVLNDINTEASEYEFNAIFFATANNLGSILVNNPEFLRRGRWDELFFINLPTIESAKEIFTIYAKKFSLQDIFLEYEIEQLMSDIAHAYQDRNNQASRFPYTASEIETFCKRLDFMRKAKGSVGVEEIDECIKAVIPIVVSAEEGINKMAAQKELFVEI
ncbi:hypothetical protein CCZ01_09540 [Helicobacter monodelphidis]|nr:hypothetical protein CCZ01_09540 [Helicobacter sp. 15-1451]